MRLARDDEGQLQISRTYTFEFSETGNNRRQGASSRAATCRIRTWIRSNEGSNDQWFAAR